MGTIAASLCLFSSTIHCSQKFGEAGLVIHIVLHMNMR
jgi:hypothetical protein